MSRFELIIFDWDGTLSDSAALIVSHMQGAIAELTLPARSDQEISQLIGLGLEEGMGRLFPEIETSEVLRLLHGYRKRFAGTAPQEAPLFDGALEALQMLHGAGARVAVATGKSRVGLDRSLRALPQLSSLLTSSRCADETANKPDPLMLRELLAETGVAIDRALMVGDTEYDAAMAAAIGMPMVGVACGVHEEDRIRRAGAQAVIESVAALPEWIARS